MLIESGQVTLAARAVSALAESGATVFFCDEKHLPCCQLLPVNRYCRQRKMLSAQWEMEKPLQKRLWQQIVVQKIKNQAKCLVLAGREGQKELQNMAGRVLSGDRDNREAVAAAFYFPALFGEGFIREREDPRNSALNYGYAILRGCVARRLVVHGLEPCLGLHHHSELNNFNLADDLIEPFRPVVDLYVATRFREDGEDLSPDQKVRLFNLSHYLVEQAGKRYGVFTAIDRSCASLARCYTEGAQKLELPELIPLEEQRYE